MTKNYQKNQKNGVEDCGESRYFVVVETKALRKRQENKLDVAELNMLRFFLGMSRVHRNENKNTSGTGHVRC